MIQKERYSNGYDCPSFHDVWEDVGEVDVPKYSIHDVLKMSMEAETLVNEFFKTLESYVLKDGNNILYGFARLSCGGDLSCLYIFDEKFYVHEENRSVVFVNCNDWNVKLTYDEILDLYQEKLRNYDFSFS